MMEHIYPSVKEYIHSKDIATNYDSYYSGFTLFKLDTEILDDIIREKGKILDVGCGTGRHVIHFLKKGFDVTGVDLSYHMLEVVKKKLKEQNLKCKLIQADMHNLTCINDKFHYIILMYSTFGLVKGRKNRIKVLSELSKLLNPNGILIIHIYRRIWGEILKFIDYKWYLRNSKKYMYFDFEPGDFLIKDFRGIKDFYYHKFTISEIKELLYRANLKLKKIIYIKEEERKANNFIERLLSDSLIVVANKMSFQEHLREFLKKDLTNSI